MIHPDDGCKVGYSSILWTPHTDKNNWKKPSIKIDKDRDLYHGQPIECWDNEDIYGREHRFYDAINKTAVTCNGILGGHDFGNYRALTDIPEWMIEAQKTLKL